MLTFYFHFLSFLKEDTCCTKTVRRCTKMLYNKEIFHIEVVAHQNYVNNEKIFCGKKICDTQKRDTHVDQTCLVLHRKEILVDKK